MNHHCMHTTHTHVCMYTQLESLLQRVQDALHPVLHTTTTPSHIHTSLIDAPPLSFTAKLQHQEKKEEEGEKRGRKSVLDENFDSALAELLGGGSDKGKCVCVCVCVCVCRVGGRGWGCIRKIIICLYTIKQSMSQTPY